MSQNNIDTTNTIYNKKEKNPSEKGCLWIKQNSKNIDYFSIKLNLDGKDIFLKAFLNGGKRPGDKSPDYIIFESTFKKQESAGYSDRDVEEFNK